MKSFNKKLEQNTIVYRFLEEHPNHDIHCVVERERRVIAKMRTFDFPDTCSFKGDILNKNYQSNQNSEEYARLVLLHFMPYRNLEHLKRNGTFLRKFQRELDKCYFRQRKLNPDTERILQHIQNRRNNAQVPPRTDELKERTACFQGHGDIGEASNDKEDDDNGD